MAEDTDLTRPGHPVRSRPEWRRPLSGGPPPAPAGRQAGDGWVFVAMYDQARTLSHFVRLDAQAVETGSAPSVEQPIRGPFGVHGN